MRYYVHSSPHLDKFEMTPGTEISRISLYSKPLLA